MSKRDRARDTARQSKHDVKSVAEHQSTMAALGRATGWERITSNRRRGDVIGRVGNYDINQPSIQSTGNPHVIAGTPHALQMRRYAQENKN